MKFPTVVVCVLLAIPMAAPAANKEIQELQRDIALLQQQLKDLQSSQDKNFAAVTELARQAIEAANRANTGVAVVTSNMEKTLDALRTSTAAPLAGLNSRLNETSTELRELHQAVADQAATLTRMQQMLNDIKELAKADNSPWRPLRSRRRHPVRPPKPSPPSRAATCTTPLSATCAAASTISPCRASTTI